MRMERVGACVGGVGTVRVYQPFLNGKCVATSLSWFALGVTNRGSQACVKLDTVALGSYVDLPGVKAGEQVFAWVHDGSFSSATTSLYPALKSGAYSLAGSCRSNNAANFCGPYVVGTLSC